MDCQKGLIIMESFVMMFGFVVFFALFGSYAPASAYIDPATTSYMMELIIAAVVLGGAAAGYYWRKLKNKVKKDDTPDKGVSVDEQLQSDDDED